MILRKALTRVRELTTPPVFTTDLVGTLATTVPNIMEHRINGSMKAWVNEWGALRGTSPYTWGDALFRAIRDDGDGITQGLAFHLNDRRTGAVHVNMWGVRWQDGRQVANNVPLNYVKWTTNWATDPDNPANGGLLPANVIVIQKNP